MKDPILNFNHLVLAAIISCMLLLALISLLKKNTTPAGYSFLCLLFLLLAVSFTGDLLESSGLLLRYPYLAMAFEPILFAAAPVIWLSVRHLVITDKVRKGTILHFIPYTILLGLYMLSFASEEAAGNNEKENILIQRIVLSTFFIQIGVYLLLSLRLLKKYRNRLPLFVSNFTTNDLSWLRNTILALCFLTLILLAEVVFEQIRIPFYFPLIYLIGFYYLGVQIVLQKDVVTHSEAEAFQPEDKPAEKSAVSSPVATIARKPVLSEDEIRTYKARLMELMETKEPFLDSEITLPKLGNMLSLNTYQVSYLINTCFGTNFYVFINNYRLERCKQMLPDPTFGHLSILGIAFEAGFNSKTAFNTTFKKHTGLSPKAFREQCGNSGKIGSDLSVD